MWTVLMLGQPAWATPPAEETKAIELTGTTRRSDDVTVFVRYDGNLFFHDELVLDYDLAPMLKQAIDANPATRIVIAADSGAPYEGLMKAVDLAREAGARSIAFEARGLTDPPPAEVDPLFPGVGEVEELGQDLTKKQERALRPKRWKFPQNPYGNTNSFTAYALEQGEAKIGLGAVNVGVFPRFQVGTVPVLDVVGVFNANAKYNFLHAGPLDAAMIGQYYYVPLTNILDAVGAGQYLTGEDTRITSTASYFAVGATGSLRVAKPWTLHTQLYWGSPSARGDIAFDDLPEVLIPGLSLPQGGAEVGIGVKADLAILNVATDLRFNRRDSVYAWLRYPFYGRIRGVTGGSISGFEELENADVMIAYGDFISLADSYSVAVGYQASWKHFEARVGVGWSAVPATWLLQAFELSYKFGGTTRRRERDIRKGYKELKDQDEATPPPPGG